MRYVALLLAVVTACCGPDHGIVTDKDHQDAWVQSTTIMVGKTFIPQSIYHDEQFRVLVDSGDDEGWRTVTESEFETISIGDSVSFND